MLHGIALFPSMHSRNYIEPPLTSFNATSRELVSTIYLSSNGKYCLRNRVAARFRNAGVYLSAIYTGTRGVSALTPSCKSRRRCAWSRRDNRICQIYTQCFRCSRFFSLLFFFCYMREARGKTERAGRKIHYVPPLSRLSKNNVRRTCVYQMRRVDPRITREAEHRLIEETR